MAWYPKAVRRPITASKGRKRLTVWNRVNLHSTASSASSQFGYFNKTGIADSHFHVAYDGTVEQYVDTAWRAFADLDGNDATISIETAGVAKDGNEKWTVAQVKAIIELVAWIMRTHNIPLQLASNARVGSAESRGLSWHRLGIDGNFPSSGQQAGRLQRGATSTTDSRFMHYSSHYGKICPGYGRITQIHEDVYPGVRALIEGAQEDDDMALTNEDKTWLRDLVQEELEAALHDREINVPSALVEILGATASRDSILTTTAQRSYLAERDTDDMRTKVSALHDGTEPKVDMPWNDGATGQPVKYTLRSALKWIASKLQAPAS